MKEGTVTYKEIEPVIEYLRHATQEWDSMDGEILDLITKIPGLPGQDYSDHDCLEIIHVVINKWSEL